MKEKVKRTEQQWIRILANKELPAITSVAAMLDKFSNNDISSIPYLSKAILHDQGLSSCLLKVVNSSPRAAVSKVTTISRAAIVLGISAVKNICLTSTILDGLLASKNLAPAIHQRLTMLMANAFYAGLLAKMMVPKHSDDTQEEVYLAAMLYHIGETAFWSTPNDDANRLIKDTALAPKQFQKVCKETLGLHFTDLSIGLAKTWNLGDLLIKSLDQPEARTVEMQTISLANQLSSAISSPSISKAEFDDILQRISTIMKISVPALKSRINETRELAIELLASYGANVLEQHIKALPKASDFSQLSSQALLGNMSKEKALLLSLMELSKRSQRTHDINDFLLYTLQRAIAIFSFTRCTFWMLNKGHTQLDARTSFDELGHAESFHRSIQLQGSVNVMSHVVGMDNAIVINDYKDKNWSNYMTEELEKLIGRGAICVVPVKIEQKIIGVISGQLLNEKENVNADDFAQFTFLIEHLNMCLGVISKR